MSSTTGTDGRRLIDEEAGLSIRPLTDADAAWYLGALDDEIIRWTLETTDLDEASWRRSLSRASSAGAVWNAIEASGDRVGMVKVVPFNDRVEVSYWIAPGYRGRGYASRTLAEVSSDAATSGWGRPIELEIHPDNVASIRTALRAGYAFHEKRATCDACADATGHAAFYRWPL